MNNKVSENPSKNRTDMALVVISGLLVTMYLTANIMAVKLINLFGITLFDAGTVTFPVAYMLGDVLTETWGYKTSKKVIWLTFFCNLLFVAATALGMILPYPADTSVTAEAYNTVFTYVPRIVAASLVAFLSGELSNAWFMVKIKKWTNGKHLWMRTIGSSAIGYVLDTVLFVVIAFAGTVPVKDLFIMIAAQYIIKLFIEAAAGTPLAYGLIAFLKKKIQVVQNNE